MISGRLPRLLAALAAIALVAGIYGWRIHDAPVYLAMDEVIISLDAHAIATTGHDLRGRWLPLYFQIDEWESKGTIWYQPAIMYATAAILQIAPLTEWAIRLPAVIVGVLDVILAFLVTRALYGRVAIALCTAGLLILTPAHFHHSRFAMDYIFPLPFIFGWLLALVHYDRRRDSRWIFAATFCLGVGFYSYIAAVMLMPIYACLTGLFLWQTGAPRKHHALAAAGFALPLLPFAIWLVTHPTTVADTIARYDFGNPRTLGLLDRVPLYWDYLSPSYLFFNGGSYPMFSTRTAGVFVLPMAALLLYGIYWALRSSKPFDYVLLLGFLTAPLAALLLDEGSAINRALEVVPFGVLLAAGAIHRLWARPAPGRYAWRALMALLLVLAVMQFRLFLVDYYGDYRVRSARLFQGNIQGAIEEVLQRQPAGQSTPVYLSKGLDLYWKFFVIKHGRPDLIDAVTTFEHLDALTLPPGSFVLAMTGTPVADAVVAGLVSSGQLTRIRSIDDAGATSFIVLQR